MYQKLQRIIDLFNSLQLPFTNRKKYFDLFVEHSYKSEDWIKTEIIKLWQEKFKVSFKGISHKIDNLKGKPDLCLWLEKKRITIELKVLPTDKNYKTAAQRFNANRNNKKDFVNLEKGKRDYIIYIFWKEKSKWQKQMQNLGTQYPKVQLISEFCFKIKKGIVVFSLWNRRNEKLKPRKK
jgi:hypothetical protein